MNRRLQECLLAAALAAGGTVGAQTVPPAACPEADQIEPQHLIGPWQLRLWPDGGSAERPTTTGLLVFAPHPEYPGSVRGELVRSTAGVRQTTLIAGDVVDGLFQLDESEDGVAISAVWTGEPHDCARRFTGTRRPAEGRGGAESSLHFRLDRSNSPG